MSVYVANSNPRYLVKICGNRLLRSSMSVAAAGPDLMGWIFARRSPRCIEPESAARQIESIRNEHPQISHVAVFARNTFPEIQRILSICDDHFDFFQVSESTLLVEQLRRVYADVPVLPAVQVRRAVTRADLVRFGNPPAFIMDAFVQGMDGGTGKTLDPEMIRGVRRPFLLAGGLTAANVVDALRKTSAIGADVSSGVEYSPGKKDEAAVRDFIQAVRSVSVSRQ